MTDQTTHIKALISQGNIDEALRSLDALLTADSPCKDELYYLRGNAYRKQGNWQQALNNYRYAMDINPESPAAEAHRMVMDILNFFNKDMFNQ